MAGSRIRALAPIAALLVVLAIAQPASAEDGHITFIAPAMTRAFCGEKSMDTRIARDLEFVTTYRLIGDTLNLALKMDSGIYTWRRLH